MLFRVDDYIDKFKHTLQHLAREWYHGLDMDQFGGNWREFTQHFSRYFSTQCRNIKHLHERWRSFSFDLNMDDVEEYICRCSHEAAKAAQDMAMTQFSTCSKPSCLQNCMAPLYGHDNIYIIMTILKDIYTKKPQPAATAAAATSSPRSHSPFHPHPHAPTSNASSKSLRMIHPLEERIAQLTETLY